tara:strand:- start:1222 stop:1992 length:771 start_codon:yes stop_codon:yes gene_type:complete
MYYECQAIYKTGINKGKKCGKNVCNIKSHIYQTLNYHEIHEIKHAYNLDNVYVDKCEYYSQFCVNDKINYMDIIKHIHNNRIGYAFELATGRIPYKKCCPRCIEEYEDEEGNWCKGERKESCCSGCGVCEDCECLHECGRKGKLLNCKILGEIDAERAYEITIGIIDHYKPLLDRQNSLYWNCLDKLYGEELKNAFVEKIEYFMDIYCSKYNRYYNLFLNKKTMDIHYFNSHRSQWSLFHVLRAKYKSNPIYKLLQ